MNLSYWEIKTWLSNIDFTVIGSGIVGLNCALNLRKRFPKSKILVLEKGTLPQGASTKNAGFACFGSLSEIIDDLKSHSEEQVLKLIEKRTEGLNLLRQTLGDEILEYKNLGGYELFLNSDNALYETCIDQVAIINKLLYPLFKANVFSFIPNDFGFKTINSQLSFNQFEGQIDTGKMMDALLKKATNSGIKILNSCEVNAFDDHIHSVKLKVNNITFKSNKVLIATNGFANHLIKEQVPPARAQVLITKPIENLAVRGTFHLDRGYYYFRNIDNRILLGGGRHLDFKGEETSKFGETKVIQNKLEELLRKAIIPNTEFEIDHRWSGIMGIGKQKTSVVKQLSNNVYCGVRLGGMGVAIGSLVGKELADLL